VLYSAPLSVEDLRVWATPFPVLHILQNYPINYGGCEHTSSLLPTPPPPPPPPPKKNSCVVFCKMTVVNISSVDTEILWRFGR